MTAEKMLRRMADYLDAAGKTETLIRVCITEKVALKAGCRKCKDGSLAYRTHPIILESVMKAVPK